MLLNKFKCENTSFRKNEYDARFCDKCEKVVYDMARMNDGEINTLFEKSTQVCGTIQNNRLVNWGAKAAVISFSLLPTSILTLTSFNTEAQTQESDKVLDIEKDAILVNCKIINNENQILLIDVELTVSNGSKILFKGKTDFLGEIVFSLESKIRLKEDTLTFQFVKNGYVTYIKNIPGAFISRKIDIAMQPTFCIENHTTHITGMLVRPASENQLNENGEKIKRKDINHMPSRN